MEFIGFSGKDNPTRGCHKSQRESVGDLPVELPLGKGGYVMYLVHLFADCTNTSWGSNSSKS